jgi:hypothetical protein
VVDLANSPSATSLGAEFNPFLFASIDDGVSEEPLSVVSTLARLDLDPWQAAVVLTLMPRRAAIERSDTLLAKVSLAAPSCPESGAIAPRLIGFLPRRDSSGGAAIGRTTKHRACALIDARAITVLYLTATLSMMCYLTTVRHPPMTKGGDSRAPSSMAPISEGSRSNTGDNFR